MCKQDCWFLADLTLAVKKYTELWPQKWEWSWPVWKIGTLIHSLSTCPLVRCGTPRCVILETKNNKNPSYRIRSTLQSLITRLKSAVWVQTLYHLFKKEHFNNENTFFLETSWCSCWVSSISLWGVRLFYLDFCMILYHWVNIQPSVSQSSSSLSWTALHW